MTVRYEDDHEHAEAVMKRFGIRAFPTLLVLGPDGAEWDEVWGGTAEALVEDLARVRGGKDTLPTLRAKLAANPKDYEAATDLAGRLADRHPEEAIALCKRLLAEGPKEDPNTTARLLFLQGYAQSNRAKGAWAAIALFERVLEEYPESDSTPDAVVFARNVLRELPAARGLAFLRKAMPLVDAELRTSLEFTRGSLHLQAAEAAWRRQGEEAGEDPESLNIAAWECFLRNWNTDEAIRWARKAVELSDRAPHILDTLANLLFRKGQVNEAIRLEEEAAAKATDPEERKAYEELVAMWKAAKTYRENSDEK